ESQNQALALRRRDDLPRATRLSQHSGTDRQLGQAIALADACCTGDVNNEEQHVVSRRLRGHPLGPQHPMRASRVCPGKRDGLAHLLQRYPPAEVGSRSEANRHEALTCYLFESL